jgi:nicotinamidase-related amidase
VVLGFRAGNPERDERNMTFGALPSDAFTENDPGVALHPDVAPQQGDVVVTKRRVSAFTGSDLELLLRAQGIGRLVLTGIATSGVVLSTLRQAADLDYELTVLADACYDPDPDLHEVLINKVFSRQSTIATTDTWSATLT